jgi:hypothetical protein
MAIATSSSTQRPRPLFPTNTARARERCGDRTHPRLAAGLSPPVEPRVEVRIVAPAAGDHFDDGRVAAAV